MNPARHIFIAGIGGVFMAGVAQLARAAGYSVRGCDAGVYPPMSDVLGALDIDVADGYSAAHLGRDPGTVIIGNALSRGNELVEAALARGLEYRSGPEWLREHILRGREVIAVAGTHGKTSTAAMVAWILECAGRSPGFLIGGKPGNFDATARLGDGDAPFVIEADEYDTAFFDKRAKFVHYRPRIALLNNLEFDHADIYTGVDQIIRQFHHLLRTVPGDGCVLMNARDANLASVIDMGCWSRVVKFSVDDGDGATVNNIEWRASPSVDDCSRFEVWRHGEVAARVEWQCIGRHNMANALAAIATAEVAGVPVELAAKSLRDFAPAARRMQCLFESEAAVLYDDFAHHPTAIAATIAAARARHPQHRIIAIVELRSNTMKAGVHGAKLTQALAHADHAITTGGDGEGHGDGHGDGEDDGHNTVTNIEPIATIDAIIPAVHRRIKTLNAPTAIITMSNANFAGLPARLAESLAAGA